ncbi:1-deoxy-D-xylulose 5-phosphate reductoisomerase [Bacteroidetes oral taxon 274 str. F0058]|nr:1-deoxy-D-xylulose 5-phosphate reductoisomerase [Bacteroidetes oral taxon 274 str. F0058]
MSHKQTVAILGSTGSIGTQTLDVIDRHSELFEVYALTAHSNIDLLVKQAKKYRPEVVAIADERHYKTLREALDGLPIKVFAGADSICQIAAMSPIDTVVTAMVGYSGLLPTVKAIEAGKKIALANKETLVVAGELVTDLALRNRVDIVPIDSEHSAIFQCLVGENENSVEKLILTASGGAFRDTLKDDLRLATAADALRHPTWKMGAKITIDSATMMNKGFEVIEARWLFDIPIDKIEVIIHPQSIVHSMVQFCDGSIKAQLGQPDMRHPIQYALTFPDRLDAQVERANLADIHQLTFERPNYEKFRNLGLAYDALRRGGNIPCILNAANEVAVDAFLKGKIGFFAMSDIIEQTISETAFISSPTLDDYIATDREARARTSEKIK